MTRQELKHEMERMIDAFVVAQVRDATVLICSKAEAALRDVETRIAECSSDEAQTRARIFADMFQNAKERGSW